MTESPLADLEPRILWRAFDALRQVPRPSKKEARAVAFVQDWAFQNGFETKADAASNMVVRVPASPGHESAPLVVIQGHLDMVCEKNQGVTHDFDNDPIAVEVDGDWVRAQGTTLGADNGIGVAAAMAAAVDPEVVHGPLELLMTIDEETGLNGVAKLDPEIVRGRILLNLDSEEEGALYIGCAGSAGNRAFVPVERDAEASGELYELAVKGMRGGHSGLDINTGRANALKTLTGVLIGLAEAGLALRLVTLDGGSARNAIPREAFAVVTPANGEGANDTSVDDVQKALTDMEAALRERYRGEPGLTLSLNPAAAFAESAAAPAPLTQESAERLLRLIDALPHGVLAMSQEVPDLVETSNNVAVVRTDGSDVYVECTSRSSVYAAQVETARSVSSACRLAGARVEEDRGYPGWAPNPASPLVRRTAAAYEKLFGEPPAIKAIHAGLECGVLNEKLPGLDAISFGPDLEGAHSPDERVSIASVARFYQLLSRVLADLTTS